jgi:hypothetical protein
MHSMHINVVTVKLYLFAGSLSFIFSFASVAGKGTVNVKKERVHLLSLRGSSGTSARYQVAI